MFSNQPLLGLCPAFKTKFTTIPGQDWYPSTGKRNARYGAHLSRRVPCSLSEDRKESCYCNITFNFCFQIWMTDEVQKVNNSKSDVSGAFKL